MEFEFTTSRLPSQLDAIRQIQRRWLSDAVDNGNIIDRLILISRC